MDPIEANPPELDDDGQIVETPAESSSSSADAGEVSPDAATANALGESTADADAADRDADSGSESASANLGDDTAAQLAALTETVERQNELLEKQQRTIERLVKNSPAVGERADHHVAELSASFSSGSSFAEGTASMAFLHDPVWYAIAPQNIYRRGPH